MINNIEQESVEAELFKPGKIVRMCATEKLRNLNLNNTLNIYTGRHYQILQYAPLDSVLEEKVIRLESRQYKRVYCVDPYGTIYSMPQVALVPTTVKNLQEHERALQYTNIYDRLVDSGKYELQQLTDDYTYKLREFMEASKLLNEKMMKDYTVEAEKILDIQLHTKEILQKNVQITDVNYVI